MTRAQCITLVRQRDNDTCQVTGMTLQYTESSALNYGEVHERVFRSKGGSAISPDNCILLSASAHRRVEPCVHPAIGHRSKLDWVNGRLARVWFRCCHCGLRNHDERKCHLRPTALDARST